MPEEGHALKDEKNRTILSDGFKGFLAASLLVSSVASESPGVHFLWFIVRYFADLGLL
jgi:hypothetical protein